MKKSLIALFIIAIRPTSVYACQVRILPKYFNSPVSDTFLSLYLTFLIIIIIYLGVNLILNIQSIFKSTINGLIIILCGSIVLSGGINIQKNYAQFQKGVNQFYDDINDCPPQGSIYSTESLPLLIGYETYYLFFMILIGIVALLGLSRKKTIIVLLGLIIFLGTHNWQCDGKKCRLNIINSELNSYSKTSIQSGIIQLTYSKQLNRVQRIYLILIFIHLGINLASSSKSD